MILKDVLAVDGLAVTGDRVHTVEVDAIANHGERVAREVQVGHGVNEQVGLALGVHEGVERHRAGERKLDLGLGDAGHGLLHKLKVVRNGLKKLTDGSGGDAALHACLSEPLIEELGARLGHGVERLGHKLL